MTTNNLLLEAAPKQAAPSFKWHPSLTKLHKLRVLLDGDDLLSGIAVTASNDMSVQAHRTLVTDYRVTRVGAHATTNHQVVRFFLNATAGHRGISQPGVFMSPKPVTFELDGKTIFTAPINSDSQYINGQGATTRVFDMDMDRETVKLWQVEDFKETQFVFRDPNQSGFSKLGRFGLDYTAEGVPATHEMWRLVYPLANYGGKWFDQEGKHWRSDASGCVLFGPWAHTHSRLGEYHIDGTIQPSNGWKNRPDYQHADAGIVALCQYAMERPWDIGLQWLVLDEAVAFLNSYHHPSANTGTTVNLVDRWADRGRGRVIGVGSSLWMALERITELVNLPEAEATLADLRDRVMAIFDADVADFDKRSDLGTFRFGVRRDGHAPWEVIHRWHGYRLLELATGGGVERVDMMLQATEQWIWEKTIHWGEAAEWALPYSIDPSTGLPNTGATTALTEIGYAVYQSIARRGNHGNQQKIEEILAQYSAVPARWRLR